MNNTDGNADGPLLVTGAPGKTGLRVVAALLRKGHKVRAFVRRPEAGEKLLALSVSSHVSGDLEDRGLLVRAAEGCSRIVHICPPMHPAEDRIGKTLIEAATEANVRHFILYSVLHPLIDVPHHRRKLAVEEALADSSLPHTIVQPARYMQHLAPVWREVREDGVHAMPFNTHTRFTLADLNDLAEAVAVIASSDVHYGATYQLAGPQALSQDDCAVIISRLIGRNVEARRRDPQAALDAARKAGVVEARIDNMRIMNSHYDKHGLVANANVLRWILGREPSTFEAYIKRELLNS